MASSTETETAPGNTSGQRGPVEHERREQIVLVAREHFRLYGYGKTTVADLARAIGLSTAYIYKFFDSKRAIGEVVCGKCLAGIRSELGAAAAVSGPVATRLRSLYKLLTRESVALLFNDRKLHDIVSAAVDERWDVAEAHRAGLLDLIRKLLAEGRANGEFERKTPLEETCRAVMLTMVPFMHPVLLEQNLDHVDDDAVAVANLVLRSLAP